MQKFVVLVFWLSICAGCHKDIAPDCIEKPYDGRACYQNYFPVCGCNNKTYYNVCDAASHGITNYKQGECRK